MTSSNPALDAPASGRRKWGLATVAFTIVFAVSLVFVINGIRGYHAEHSYLKPLFRVLSGSDFTRVDDAVQFVWRDRPVNLVGDFDDNGEGTVTLTYGDATETFPVGVAKQANLPLLPRIDDWLRIMLFHVPAEDETLGDFMDAVKAGERVETERLVVVTRQVNPGAGDGAFDTPKTWGWGETQRKYWTFGFYEMLAEGGIETTILDYPETGKSFRRRADRAALQGDPPPERSPTELQEASWQWYASTHVIPGNRAPVNTFEQSALSAAKWSFLTLSFSAIGGFVSFFFAIAPTRRTSEQPSPQPRAA